MKQSSRKQDSCSQGSHHCADGSIRLVLLVATAFSLGLGAGAFFLYRTVKTPGPVETVQETAVELSPGTRAVLEGLGSKVGIRYYSLLDPASVSASMQQFAARIDQLLSLYQRESNGKISVTRLNSRTNDVSSAAAADKIKPFNLDKGDPCYLGLTIVCNDQHESLPFLFPEWEQALESDITRAIARVTSVKPPPGRPVEAPKSDLAAIEEVKRAIPDLASTSVERGSQLLRLQTLALFTAATEEMETQVKAAQQRIIEAQNSGSEADQQAAVKNLQQVQAAQSEKLKQITMRLQAQIAALEQIKAK